MACRGTQEGAELKTHTYGVDHDLLWGLQCRQPQPGPQGGGWWQTSTTRDKYGPPGAWQKPEGQMMSGAGAGFRRTARDGEWAMSTPAQTGPGEQIEQPGGDKWHKKHWLWQSWSQEAGQEQGNKVLMLGSQVGANFIGAQSYNWELWYKRQGKIGTLQSGPRF